MGLIAKGPPGLPEVPEMVCDLPEWVAQRVDLAPASRGIRLCAEDFCRTPTTAWKSCLKATGLDHRQTWVWTESPLGQCRAWGSGRSPWGLVCSSGEQDTEGVVAGNGAARGKRPCWAWGSGLGLCVAWPPQSRAGKFQLPGCPPSVQGIPRRHSACVPRRNPVSFGASFDLASPSGLSCQRTKSLSAPGHAPACKSLHSALGCGLFSLFCGADPRALCVLIDGPCSWGWG